MKKNKNGKKVVVLLLALCLLLGGVIGGTIAYLTDRSATITNTFTTSDVDIELEETKNLDLKMVPGDFIDKDPKVTVVAGSEACYVFVKVEAANGVKLTDKSTAADYITYTMNTGWMYLQEGVYYRQVDANTAEAGVTYSVLQGDKVYVLPTVTKAMMEAAETDAPSLTFTAYAIQLNHLADKNADNQVDAADAWALING